MTANINSPFRRETFAEDELKGRTVRGIAESPENRAFHKAVVRWRESRDLNILGPKKRKGQVVSKWSVPLN